MLRFSFVAALALALVSMTAVAAVPTTPVHTDTIRGQQAQIKAGLDARKGAYRDLPANSREQLLAQQAVVMGLIKGKKTTEELSAPERSQLIAALEAIDRIVSKASDERMVCELRKILGSNHKERVCRTVAQVRAEREATRDQISRYGLGTRGN